MGWVFHSKIKGLAYFVNCFYNGYKCIKIISFKARKKVEQWKIGIQKPNNRYLTENVLKSFYFLKILLKSKSKMSKRTIEETTTTEFSFDDSNEQLRKKIKLLNDNIIERIKEIDNEIDINEHEVH